MPESIRNMITPPRNSAPRDTTVTIPAPAVTEPSPVPAVSDEATIRARVMAEQKARMSGINDLFAMFGGRYQTLQAQCVADPDCSLEMARERQLNEWARSPRRPTKIHRPIFMPETAILWGRDPPSDAGPCRI